MKILINPLLSIHPLLIVSILGLSACGEPNIDATDNNTTVEVDNKKPMPVYKVAITAGDYVPFKMTDETGTIVGFDIDLINAIAEESNFTADLIGVRFTDMFNATVNNEVDIAIDGLTETDERKEILLASKPYLKSTIGFLIKQNSPEKTASELLNKKIAVEKNTYLYDLIKEMGAKDVIEKDSPFLTFQSIFTDESYSAIAEEPVILYESKLFEEEHPVKFIPLTNKVDKLVIYGNKEQKELMDKVNAGLDKIIANGRYQEINKKWFGVHAKDLAVK